MTYEPPEKKRARLEAERYEKEMGKPPPEPVDDWQLNYRGTREERARLKLWMGYEDDEQQPHEDRGPQPDQDTSLF
jgi:hypothetical protein